MLFTYGEIPYFTYYIDKEEVKYSDSYIKTVTSVIESMNVLGGQ